MGVSGEKCAVVPVADDILVETEFRKMYKTYWMSLGGAND